MGEVFVIAHFANCIDRD